MAPEKERQRVDLDQMIRLLVVTLINFDVWLAEIHAVKNGSSFSVLA